jgi:hypothetical protein
MTERSVVQVRSGSGDASIEEMRERVSSRFRAVGAAAGALRAEVRAATDPRRIARRHPAWVLGAAAGAGLLAASLVRRSRSRSDNPVQATLAWLTGSPDGQRPRGGGVVRAVGAPIVRGALGLVTTVLVRRMARTLREEIRPRPRVVGPRREAAR